MAFKGFEALYRLFWFKGAGQARIMRILVEATGLVLMQPGTAFPTPLRSLLDKAFRLKDGDQINPRTIDEFRYLMSNVKNMSQRIGTYWANCAMSLRIGCVNNTLELLGVLVLRRRASCDYACERWKKERG
ncbi:hypothetical protein EV360DRAFT_70289 [Lentinula raphanica]|nr:hypothetical protein EV360DRAFT_70289 [Lentinula raphanica]